MIENLIGIVTSTGGLYLIALVIFFLTLIVLADLWGQQNDDD